MPLFYLQLGHDHMFTHPFRVTSNPTIRRHIDGLNESGLAEIINR
jgi:hypothetical protein